MTETAVSRAIRDALESLGIWVIRIQSGTIPMRGRRIHLAEPGTPDLWTPHGWLEVKRSEKEAPTDVQLRWHARAHRHGVRVATVASPAEAVRVVLGWRAEA